jgi:hypothetical protein
VGGAVVVTSVVCAVSPVTQRDFLTDPRLYHVSHIYTSHDMCDMPHM